MEVTNARFITSSHDSSLNILYKQVDKDVDYFRSQPNSSAVGEQPSANTRLQKSTVDGIQDGNALMTLQSDINRLINLVDTMVEVCKRDNVGATPGRDIST